MTDYLSHNRKSWNQTVREGKSAWVQPVTPDQIAAARQGNWSVVLTPATPVPAHWFGDIKGKDVLGLASGGGQQVPLMAAAGARVTSFDNADEMLARDRMVTDREGLPLSCEQGDMADLSRFADASFDLIFHPVSNIFVPDVKSVWREAFRVLRPGGRLLAGFMNPDLFMLDWDKVENGGTFEVRFTAPYSDLADLSEGELKARMEKGEPLEWGHSFNDQIGAQLAAGFRLIGFFEDYWDDPAHPVNAYMPCAFSTLAEKPA